MSLPPTASTSPADSPPPSTTTALSNSTTPSETVADTIATGSRLARDLAERTSTLTGARDAIDEQTSQLRQTTKTLRRTTETVRNLVSTTEKGRKELGSLKNWAEELERDILILERTVKMANGQEDGSDDGSDDELEETEPVYDDEDDQDLEDVHEHNSDCDSDSCSSCDLPPLSRSYNPPVTSTMSYIPDPLIISSLNLSSLPQTLRTGPPLNPMRPRPLSINTSKLPAVMTPSLRSPTGSVTSNASRTLQFLGRRQNVGAEGRVRPGNLYGGIVVGEVSGCAVGAFSGVGTEARNSLLSWNKASVART